MGETVNGGISVYIGGGQGTETEGVLTGSDT